MAWCIKVLVYILIQRSSVQIQLSEHDFFYTLCCTLVTLVKYWNCLYSIFLIRYKRCNFLQFLQLNIHIFKLKLHIFLSSAFESCTMNLFTAFFCILLIHRRWMDTSHANIAWWSWLIPMRYYTHYS